MPLTFDIVGGADAWHFTINPQTGELSFVSPRDFEEPIDANEDNVYEVVVSVSDGIDTTTQAMTVTVTDVAENIPPQITSPAAITIPENQTAVTTITATDPDAAPEVPPQDPFPVDGSAGASSGAAQFPSLFAGYAVRPPWRVAGVDYAVGINAGPALKNPATAPLPPNCSRDVAAKHFHVTGPASVDGWEFRGWQCLVWHGDNTSVTNNAFTEGGLLQWRADTQNPATNGIIKYNLFDQTGATPNEAPFIVFRPGVYVVEYNWFRNSRHMHTQFTNGDPGQTIILRYNLMENAGLGATDGAHGDWNQAFGGYKIDKAIIEYNTVVQNRPEAATQGWSFAHEPTIMEGSVSRNTHIIKTNTNYAILVSRQWLMTPFKIQDNYVDMTGVGGAFLMLYDGAGPGPNPNGNVAMSGNKNLVTGGSIG